jgi:hypothetical protein
MGLQHLAVWRFIFKIRFSCRKKLFHEIKNRNILRSEGENHDPFSRSRPIISYYVGKQLFCFGATLAFNSPRLLSFTRLHPRRTIVMAGKSASA